MPIFFTRKFCNRGGGTTPFPQMPYNFLACPLNALNPGANGRACSRALLSSTHVPCTVCGVIFWRILTSIWYTLYLHCFCSSFVYIFAVFCPWECSQFQTHEPHEHLEFVIFRYRISFSASKKFDLQVLKLATKSKILLQINSTLYAMKNIFPLSFNFN